MISKDCPFSSKIKLKVILKGKHDCVGFKERDDKDVDVQCGACMNCSFFRGEQWVWQMITTTPNLNPNQKQLLIPYATNTTRNDWYTYGNGSTTNFKT